MGTRDIVDGLTRDIIEVRGWTKELVDRTPDEWFWRRVDWTDNTIGWHVAHLAYEQDAYGHAYLGSERIYGDDWRRMFGYGSEPMDAADCPPAAGVRAEFAAAQERFLDTLGTLDDVDLTRPAVNRADGVRLSGVTGIFAHEAEHYGGIQTLLLHFERLAGATR